jgi:hypothetical protein
MKLAVTFPDSDDQRIRYCAELCRSSINRFPEIELLEIASNPRPFFDKMLSAASVGGADWFGWINGDCQLLTKPSELDLSEVDVYGLRRIELGIGDKCGGVDGCLIRRSFWEEFLSKDLPSMYIGGTHIDWWLTRATQKFGRYAEGFWLAHMPHERTQASCGTDDYGAHNLREYEAWADRNEVSKE